MGFVQAGNLKIGEGIPKICIPILGKSEEDILNAARDAKDSEADFAELRIDWYEESVNQEKTMGLVINVKKILDQKPLLFTFRSAKEGGKKEITSEEYIQMNYKVIESGCVDLIDVELSMGHDLAVKLVKKAHEKGIKVIISSHDFKGTPDKEILLNLFSQMDLLGADILKIAVFPHSRQDVITLLLATIERKENYSKKPIITMSMGELGMISRLSGEFFGSCVTFGILKEASAPGQIAIEDLKQAMQTLHVDKKNNLFFIGFMGAGKSTVAKAMAQRLQASLIEIDEEIEKSEGLAITEIFERFSESHFRDLESKQILKISESDNNVISCGGGITLREVNVRNMKENGKIVYLKASPETIFERVKDFDTRPNLNGHMNIEYIHKLMQKRCEGYEEAADIIVETDGKEISRILDEIRDYHI